MAEKKEEYPLGTPQEHALICEKHNSMPIDIICEDCEDFICSKCVKEDHKDHNWDTITSAATVKTRGLLNSLNKIEKEFISRLDEQIHNVNEKMKENEGKCNTEVERSRSHRNTMVKKINEIGKQHEKQLRDGLVNKNVYLRRVRLCVDQKKKNVLQRVKSLKENYGTMTDIVLLKTHRNLIKLMTTEDDCTEKCEFSLKYECVDSNGELLESMMGRVFDFDSEEISVVNSKTNSLIWRKLVLLVKSYRYGLFFYSKIFLSFSFFLIALFSSFPINPLDSFVLPGHTFYLFSLLMLFLSSLGYILVFVCVSHLHKIISLIWRCLRFVVKGCIF